MQDVEKLIPLSIGYIIGDKYNFTKNQPQAARFRSDRPWDVLDVPERAPE